jgi:hypothetical protein
VDLAGGNPLFAREITISAVETFKDSVQTDVDSSLNSEVRLCVCVLEVSGVNMVFHRIWLLQLFHVSAWHL